MKLNEASKIIGKSKKALYHHIARGTELGKIFWKKNNEWNVYMKDLKKVMK